MGWQYRCLEADGDAVITAATQDELVEKVNAFLGERYGSFELEDVILDGAEPVETVEQAGGGA